MRILYTSERPLYPWRLGGAARAAHHLLRLLIARNGAECTALCSAERIRAGMAFDAEEHEALGVRGITRQNGTWTIDCGYPVRAVPHFFAASAELMRRERPDVVCAQLDGAFDLVRQARALGLAALWYLHDADFDPAQVREAARLGVRMVACSGFIKDLAARRAGVDATPVLLMVDPAEFEVEAPSEAGYLTLINPVPIKGVGTVLRCAARLPEQRFLLVESWPLDRRALAAIERVLAHLPNVRFIRRQVDMRGVYGQTRILLVPSASEEAGARVVREAQLSGIPSIVSGRGGLPEAGGAGAIVIDDPFGTDAWVAAIQSLTGDPARLRALGEAARAHAHSDDYSTAVNVDRFLDACRAAQDAATRVPA